MKDASRRLDRLEVIWSKAERPAWLAALEEEADETAESIALRRHLFVRAQRRYLAEHGKPPTSQEADGAEFAERERRELADLVLAQETLGVDAGWEVWLAEGADWPQLAGRPNDAESYAKDVAYFTGSQDRLRDSPSLAAWRERTGWQLTAEGVPT